MNYKKKLTSEQYDICFLKGIELSGSGKYYKHFCINSLAIEFVPSKGENPGSQPHFDPGSVCIYDPGFSRPTGTTPGVE